MILSFLRCPTLLGDKKSGVAFLSLYICEKGNCKDGLPS